MLSFAICWNKPTDAVLKLTKDAGCLHISDHCVKYARQHPGCIYTQWYILWYVRPWASHMIHMIKNALSWELDQKSDCKSCCCCWAKPDFAQTILLLLLLLLLKDTKIWGNLALYDSYISLQFKINALICNRLVDDGQNCIWLIADIFSTFLANFQISLSTFLSQIKSQVARRTPGSPGLPSFLESEKPPFCKHSHTITTNLWQLSLSSFQITFFFFLISNK